MTQNNKSVVEILEELCNHIQNNQKNIIVKKRNGSYISFDKDKIKQAIKPAFKRCHVRYTNNIYESILQSIYGYIANNIFQRAEIDATDDTSEIFSRSLEKYRTIEVEKIQDIVETMLMESYPQVAKEYIIYRKHKEQIRDWVDTKEEFITKYKGASNTANATIDDNSNVSNRNIGIMNNEIHKEDNVQINRRMVVRKLRSLFPDFDAKQYERDLSNHLIYKHDESSFAGAIAPYCVALTMYPFLEKGIKGIGGLSARPKNLDSYCGMLVNMIFAVSSQFAGACACPEALLYFDYFARKEWGDDYYKHIDDIVNPRSTHPRTIHQQIHQHFQQVIYSINQPAAARGLQSAFVNFSYYDKAFFESMFGDFMFPDFTKPIWDSLNWLQKDFMKWFNQERLRCVLTFPVESFAMVYKDGKFLDEENADFIAEEYARGHSFFTYISDTVDSLSSCCRLRNAIDTKEFNFTNGNLSLQTGSKSVITLNLNRIIQDCVLNQSEMFEKGTKPSVIWWKYYKDSLKESILEILDRVYMYHTAYNEILWDMKNANLLPVYDAGFINLDKQYLTIGLNGLNQAAEYLGMTCNDNEDYKQFCQFIFSTISESNKLCETNKSHESSFNGHKIKFNTEMVPAESLGVKNLNWDKEDGYWVPSDTNLYASYVFKPNDDTTDIYEKIRMHGKEYIGEFLDGGSAAHINLSEHLTKDQYANIIKYTAEVGCNYFTFNIPMTECNDCGHIVNTPVHTCPECGSDNIKYWTRIIGYLTAVPAWSKGRQDEFKTRIFHDPNSKSYVKFDE